jgi:hypothetical protein
MASFFAAIRDLRATGRPGWAPTSREARFATYVGNNLALTKTVWGQKMFVDTRDISLAPHLIVDGVWEPWLSNVFARTVKAGMTVVDVGANFGYYTLLAGRQLAGSGEIHSFEPNPGVFDILLKNVSINGLERTAHCHNMADVPGEGLHSSRCVPKPYGFLIVVRHEGTRTPGP